MAPAGLSWGMQSSCGVTRKETGRGRASPQTFHTWARATWQSHDLAQLGSRGQAGDGWSHLRLQEHCTAQTGQRRVWRDSPVQAFGCQIHMGTRPPRSQRSHQAALLPRQRRMKREANVPEASLQLASLNAWHGLRSVLCSCIMALH